MDMKWICCGLVQATLRKGQSRNLSMSGEVRISMPADLRSNVPRERFQLQEESNFTSDILSWRRRGVTSFTVSTPTQPRFKLDGLEPPTKSRWKTPEFIAYILIVAVAIPIMVRVPMRLSDSSHPNYLLFARRLSPGWIPGRHVDNSDSQYRSFRNNLLPLTFLACLFLLLSFIYTRATRSPSPISQLSFANSSRLSRIPFLILFSLSMIIFLHGFSALKIIIIMLVNFFIAKFTCCPTSPTHLGPLLTWAFNCVILYSNEIYGGYKFAHLHPVLHTLDEISGFYPRWHISFNITMLRLVSFNMDYYWASRSQHRPLEDETNILHAKQRPSTPHDPKEWYSLTQYFAYILYPPLYIAGPIMTFNDFLWQLRRPPAPENSAVFRASTASYMVRFFFCLLTMELVLHFMYVVAIKDASAWHGDSPLELCMIGFWNLIIVWLKLLLPWRFFRLWALLDGMDPPENMVRCMANNYSTLGFWRSWHRSYNLWLLRYIYIPVGGTRRMALSTLLVFTFVALWHDLSFRLLTWGWLVSFFIVPELLARWVFTPTKYGDYWWYRHLCALGGVFNVLAMMSANLIGFVIGTEGMKYMVQQLFGSWQGLRFLSVACGCLFVGVQVMFEYREEERRKGIYRRY